MKPTRISLRRRMHGLTLIELMATLTIAAVLLSLAVPSFVSLIERHRASTAANDLMRALLSARTQALSTGERVVLSPMVADGDWHEGWQVFLDNNNNAALDGAPETRLRQFAALPSSTSLTPSAGYGDPGKRYVSFDALGFPRSTGGALSGTGTFVIQTGSTQRAVCLGVNGRVWVLPGNSCT